MTALQEQKLCFFCFCF